MERTTWKWKIKFLLICGVMLLKESPVKVGAEQNFVDSDGNTHFLDGYDAHSHFVSSIETSVGEKLKKTLSYSLKYTKFELDFFLINVDSLSYSFLQFFHSVFSNDITFANIFSKLFSIENGTFSNWLATNINLPEEHVYKVVKIISEGNDIGLSPLPNILMNEIIFMNTKYKYFWSACSKGDSSIIQWAIRFGLPLEQFGSEGLKSAWVGKHWDIVKFLVGNEDFPIKNITDFSNLTNENNETLLHFGAETDHHEFILSLLNAGADINAVDIFGKSPLQRGIETFRTATVYKLLSNGANFNHETESGDSLLHVTARIGNFEAANLLMKEGFEIRRKNGDGFTAFNILERIGIKIIFNSLLARCSISEGKEGIKKLEMRFSLNYGNTCIYRTGEDKTFLRNLTTIAKLLLKKGAQSDLNDEDKVTLLFMAIDNKLHEGLYFLLATGIPALNISQGLQKAVITEDVLIMKHLLDAGADMRLPNSEEWKPIHTAVSKGKINAVKFLLEKGDDVNSRAHKGTTVLHIAIATDQSEIVNFLLEKGANIRAQDAEGMQPIHFAAIKGLEHIIKILLEKGANPNAKDHRSKTPLAHASPRGFLNIVRILLDNGANVNSREEGGGTALHRAIWGGIDIVILLLNRGAFINARDEENKTALYKASQGGITDVVKVLVERGADVNMSDEIGFSPLHLASESGYVDIVQLLLDFGANVEAVTDRRETPLFQAALYGNHKIVRLLIAKGANVNSANRQGVTPIQAAQRKGYGPVVNELRRNGA